MRAVIIALIVVSAAAYQHNFAPDNCPSGCNCGPSTCTATCTYPPTASPTATPTATPTSPVGACCGKKGDTNYCVVVDEDDCNVAEVPRRSGALRDIDSNGAPFNGDSWTVGANCQDACGTGIPIVDGDNSFMVDASNAGLGATGGISLTPKTTLAAEETNALNGKELILAFQVDRFDGGDEMDSDFLAQNNYIWVDIQAVPEITDPTAVAILRFDVPSGEFVDIQEECTGKIQSTAFILDENTDPNTLRVPLCHTSTFVLTNADDGADSKKTKKAKTPSAAKGSKAAKSGKKGKAGKKASATTNIAVGVGIGGGALVAIGAGVAYKCRNGKKDNKQQTGPKKAKRGAIAAPSLPAGAMTV